MKCKLLFETKNVPTFEDFEKSIHQCEGCSIRMIIERACQIIPYSFIKGYLLTPADQCYKFEYYKDTARILTEAIGELKPKVPLTFETLRKANIARLPEFKNSKGEPAHSKEDGSDWSPAQWLQAVIGELGEYANVMKKVKRGDLTFEEAKPSIEKELADVMTYLDILAFRVGVDLSKAVEQKFNEVSERVGCSLRIENNEVVRREVKVEEFKLPVTVTNKELQEAREAFFNKSKEDIEKDLKQIKEGGCGTSIFENYDYNPKNGELTPKLTGQELFLKKLPYSDIGDLMNQMIRWKLFRNYAEIYPLKIPHNAIDDIYSFEFQGIDNAKQYLFYHAKRIFIAKDNMTLRVVAIAQSNLFSYFSKQLGTKIVGMLINGHKENKILNPNDTVQFYDEKNVLYNFRLVKSSNKNVGVSAT